MPSCSRTRLSGSTCSQVGIEARGRTWGSAFLLQNSAPTWSHPSWSQPTWSHPTGRHPCPKKDGLLASGGSQLGGDGASQGASLSCTPTVMEAG